MKSVAVFILIALALSSAQDFECKDTNTVNYYDNLLKCPDGLICNSKQVKVGSAKPKPCVAPSAICDYSCDAKNNDNVIINSISFPCKTGSECNAKKTSCDVCVPKKCAEGVYSCKEGKPEQFFIGLYEGNCPADYICNTHNVQPCTPCVCKDKISCPPATRKRSIFQRSYYA
ncbi:uncharacterized protein [Atheta coriaria]|uniref:uncharacterized protein n=1 Tax=Dalotia coriaria TaxID=877792 RepID=UPI0031F40D3B